MSAKLEKKQSYFAKLIHLFETYPKLIVVGVDNVGSSQMQQIRISLRGKAEVLMGKNTMIRKAMRGHLAKNPRLEELMYYVRGNIGFVFTKGDLSDVRQKLLALRVEAPAKVGTIAPNDVIVPPGATGLEPTQTSFLQALNIASKINKGQVEIISEHLLLKKGDKVGQSEAALLAKLNIKPFSYGMTLVTVYNDGFIHDPDLLTLTDADIVEKFAAGVRNVAAVGMQLSFPTTAAVPHLLVHAYKNLLSIACATDVTFPRAEKVKAFLRDPGAFAAAAPVAAPVAVSKPAAAPKKPDPEPEPDDEPMGLSLFE